MDDPEENDIDLIAVEQAPESAEGEADPAVEAEASEEVPDAGMDLGGAKYEDITPEDLEDSKET